MLTANKGDVSWFTLAFGICLGTLLLIITDIPLENKSINLNSILRVFMVIDSW